MEASLSKKQNPNDAEAEDMDGITEPTGTDYQRKRIDTITENTLLTSHRRIYKI